MQPLQYDLRSPAAKDNSITNAATARSNLDAAITLRSAETELQNTIELRATASVSIQSPSPNLDDLPLRCDGCETVSCVVGSCSDHGRIMVGSVRHCKWGFVHLLAKHRVSCICYLSKTHFVRDFLQNSIGNSSTSTTCNAICIAGTILQLQITMEFCRPHMHETQVKPHLQCGTDPTMIRA